MDVTKLISSRNPGHIPAPRGEFVDTETGLTLIEGEGILVAVLTDINQLFRAHRAILRLLTHSQSIGALALPPDIQVRPDVITLLANDGIVLTDTPAATALDAARAFVVEFATARARNLKNLQEYNDQSLDE